MRKSGKNEWKEGAKCAEGCHADHRKGKRNEAIKGDNVKSKGKINC